MKSLYLIMVLCACALTQARPQTARSSLATTVHDRILTVNRRLVDDNVVADDVINDINKELERPDIIEGDIIIPKAEVGKHKVKRSADSNIWYKGIVPYSMDDSLPDYYKEIIEDALKSLQMKTCLTFHKKTDSDIYAVNFFRGNGCYSYVGQQFIYGGQPVSIGRGCADEGIVTHEVMHALGFHHEQSRPDRDDHVEILWENIAEGKEVNFNKATTSDTQGLQYDFGSLMHYGTSAFSKNGEVTIKAITGQMTMGQRGGPSNIDITGINMLYGCKGGTEGQITEWSTWTACDSSCSSQRQRYCKSGDPTSCPGTDDWGLQTQHANCAADQCEDIRDGHWGRWTGFSTCSKTCELGTRLRTRICDNPAPENGGADCEGVATQSDSCYKFTESTCGKGSVVNDFEDGFGVWKIIVSGTPWTQHSGSTPTSRTGPSHDKTLGSSGDGTYVYFESSFPVKTGNTGILQSASLVPKTSLCMMDFYYSMYGSTMGKLEVKVIPEGQPGQVVWEQSGDQGESWKYASVTLSTTGGAFKVEFIATKGSNYRSDIAIDDVSFFAC